MIAVTRQHICVASRKKEEGAESQESRPTESLQMTSDYTSLYKVGHMASPRCKGI